VTCSQSEDYPGIIPYSIGRDFFDHELSQEERSVRGSLVVGLTKEDLEFLDVFEGDVCIEIFFHWLLR
jgi:hypothetical protein